MRLFPSGLLAVHTAPRRPAVGIFLAAVLLLAAYRPVSADHHYWGTDGHNPSCWKSERAVAAHAVNYQITSSVPGTWGDWIRGAAAAWTNVSTSSFRFGQVSDSPNDIQVKNLGASNGAIAKVTVINYDSNTIFAPIVMTFNSYYSHGPANGWDYHPQNTAAHEFGHFLSLKNLTTDGCQEQTMWNSFGLDETKKMTLAQHDIEGISWQYP